MNAPARAGEDKRERGRVARRALVGIDQLVPLFDGRLVRT
jgi:hypothetical protein